MCYSDPALLDALLSHLADQMATYIKYQIDSGAHCVQVRTLPRCYTPLVTERKMGRPGGSDDAACRMHVSGVEALAVNCCMPVFCPLPERVVHVLSPDIPVF